MSDAGEAAAAAPARTFLSLGNAVRNKIYHHVFTRSSSTRGREGQDHTVEVGLQGGRDAYRLEYAGGVQPLTILRTCKQVKQEAEEWYWTRTAFAFSSTDALWVFLRGGNLVQFRHLLHSLHHVDLTLVGEADFQLAPISGLYHCRSLETLTVRGVQVNVTTAQSRALPSNPPTHGYDALMQLRGLKAFTFDNELGNHYHSHQRGMCHHPRQGPCCCIQIHEILERPFVTSEHPFAQDLIAATTAPLPLHYGDDDHVPAQPILPLQNLTDMDVSQLGSRSERGQYIIRGDALGPGWIALLPDLIQAGMPEATAADIRRDSADLKASEDKEFADEDGDVKMNEADTRDPMRFAGPELNLEPESRHHGRRSHHQHHNTSHRMQPNNFQDDYDVSRLRKSQLHGYKLGRYKAELDEAWDADEMNRM